MDLQNKINQLFEQSEYTPEDRKIFDIFQQKLNKGEIRAAEPDGDDWKVNFWVKRGILVGFKMGKLVESGTADQQTFIDKDTYPPRQFDINDRVRLVPGGSSVRSGAYVAPSVVMMPPMYVNVGAYIDSGSMVDSHALVGSCAQIGKNVHLSAAAQIGGVIEPIGANPVILEDNVFVGGNCGVYEGVIVKKRAILAPGTILTNSVPVYDAVNDCYLARAENQPLTIPENAVVVPGSRPLKSNPEISLYCPVIVKYRDEKSDASLNLEELLR